MIRVGAVNIDTSHPMGFGDIFKKEGRACYFGVYNDSFRSDKEVAGFCQRYSSKRYTSLEALARDCDIGFVQGCNWDDHLRCAMPFINAGKPVFIDKPIVGSEKACREVEALVQNGAVILGSSSARYAYEIAEFMAIPESERGKTISVLGTSGVDEFNYGIHVVEAISAIAGNGAKSVRFIGKGEHEACKGKYSESFHIEYENGTNAIYTTFTGTWQPFCLTVITSKSTYALKLDSNRLYEALIHEICNYMEGKENKLAKASDILEAVRIMLAGKASREQDGDRKDILLGSLKESDKGFDGTEFSKAYAAASGPMYEV